VTRLLFLGGENIRLARFRLLSPVFLEAFEVSYKGNARRGSCRFPSVFKAEEAHALLPVLFLLNFFFGGVAVGDSGELGLTVVAHD
jgi:hypothetical protein